MVNPLVSGLPVMPVAPIAAESERSAALPEAARQVTAAMSSTDSNNATEGNNLLRHGDPSNALEKAVGQANDNLRAWSTGMRFDTDPASKRIGLSSTASTTGQVIEP